MPSEPDNNKMEELLKAYAKKRRQDGAAPFELHPATRKLLQGEVDRVYSKSRQPESLPWFKSLLTLWPRIAFASAILLTLAGALWLVNQPNQKSQTLAMADRDLKRGNGPRPESKSLRDEARDLSGVEQLTREKIANTPRDYASSENSAHGGDIAPSAPVPPPLTVAPGTKPVQRPAPVRLRSELEDQVALRSALPNYSDATKSADLARRRSDTPALAVAAPKPQADFESAQTGIKFDDSFAKAQKFAGGAPTKKEFGLDGVAAGSTLNSFAAQGHAAVTNALTLSYLAAQKTPATAAEPEFVAKDSTPASFADKSAQTDYYVDLNGSWKNLGFAENSRVVNGAGTDMNLGVTRAKLVESEAKSKTAAQNEGLGLRQKAEYGFETDADAIIPRGFAAEGSLKAPAASPAQNAPKPNEVPALAFTAPAPASGPQPTLAPARPAPAARTATPPPAGGAPAPVLAAPTDPQAGRGESLAARDSKLSLETAKTDGYILQGSLAEHNLGEIKRSPAAPVILENFKLVQTGKAIRFVDSDGSTYDGELDLPQTDSLAEVQAGFGNKTAPEKPALQRYYYRALAETNVNLSTYRNGLRAQPVSFRVSGTNRTLRQLVVVTGRIDSTAPPQPGDARETKLAREFYVLGDDVTDKLSKNAEAAAAAGAGGTFRSRSGSEPTNVNYSGPLLMGRAGGFSGSGSRVATTNVSYRISGTAVIGGSNQIKLLAVPVPTPAR